MHPPMEKNKPKKTPFYTVIVFCVLVFGFFVFHFALPDVGFSESENRYLQQAPKFTWSNVVSGKFSKDTETYLNDQFPARDFFVGLKSQTEYFLGKRETNDVYFAKGGSLIPAYRDWEIDRETLGKNLTSIGAFAKAQQDTLGPGHVAVLYVPTAADTLADRLPAFAPNADQYEIFLKSAKNDLPAGVFLDVAPTLRAHRDEEIYYRTDHHWTTLGAFYAYEEYRAFRGLEPAAQAPIFETVSDRFYGTTYSKARLWWTRPDSIERLAPDGTGPYLLTYNLGEFSRDSLYDESYLSKRDQYSYFLGGNQPLVVIQSEQGKTGRLLLVKDSFAHSFVPFAADDFEQIHCVDLRYYNGSIKKYIEDNQITDILVLYNFSSLESDGSIVRIKY